MSLMLPLVTKFLPINHHYQIYTRNHVHYTNWLCPF